MKRLLGSLLLVTLLVAGCGDDGDGPEGREPVNFLDIKDALATRVATFVRDPGVFLVVSLLVGFTSVSVQILVPLAAHFAPDASRGR